MGTHKIIKKAWELNTDKLQEGYLYSTTLVYANTRNKARSLLLQEVRYDECILLGETEEVTYLNIPVKRCKGSDIVEFEGKEVSRYKINEIIADRERSKELDALLENKDIDLCYIQKGYSYYRENNCGYTDRIYEAGIYDKEDAVSQAKSCRELTIIPVDLEKHNKSIRDKIELLYKEIIEIESKFLTEELKIK